MLLQTRLWCAFAERTRLDRRRKTSVINALFAELRQEKHLIPEIDELGTLGRVISLSGNSIKVNSGFDSKLDPDF